MSDQFTINIIDNKVMTIKEQSPRFIYNDHVMGKITGRYGKHLDPNTVFETSPDLSHVQIWNMKDTLPKDALVYYADIKGLSNIHMQTVEDFTIASIMPSDYITQKIDFHQRQSHKHHDLSLVLGTAAAMLIVFMFICVSAHVYPVAYCALGSFTTIAGGAIYSRHKAQFHLTEISKWQHTHNNFVHFNNYNMRPIDKIIFDTNKTITIDGFAHNKDERTSNKSYIALNNTYGQLLAVLRYAIMNKNKKIFIAPTAIPSHYKNTTGKTVISIHQNSHVMPILQQP